MSSEVANQENNSSELIEIRVKLIFHHGTVVFRMKKSTAMSNLFNLVAHRLRVPACHHLLFLLDGDRISPIETPEMLDWCENNYRIDCFLEVPNCISFNTPKHRPFITCGNLVAVSELIKKTSVWFTNFDDMSEYYYNIDDDIDEYEKNKENKEDNNNDEYDGVNNDHSNNIMDSWGMDLPVLLLQKSRVLKTLVVGEYYKFECGDKTLFDKTLFFDALAKNVTLRTLGLQGQHDDYPGPSKEWTEQLAAALMVNESLVSINLTGNFLYDRGSKWLGIALKVNTSLREIDLTGNEIGNEGSQWLGDALRENTTLFKIVLCNNCIGDRGADWIAEGLEVNKTLRQMDLSGNRIYDRGAECLAAAIKINKSLSEVWLSRNKFGKLGVESFVDALKVNKTLTYIKLGDNLDSINLMQKRHSDEITHLKAILASKDELIQAAEKNDERLLTLEAELERKNQELALKDKENAATIRSKDDKIAALEAALKNSKPIETVDLTSGADGNDFSCTNNSASSPPLKKPRRDREEDRPKSIFQSFVQVKEEKQAAETALEDVRDDLDIAQTTLMQEAVYTDAWRTRFDELANIAKGAGVDGALIQGIRNRSFV